MDTPINYRRPGFLHRPWITGGLYDKYALATVMHVDAFVFTFGGREYLMVDYRLGGSKCISLDGWLVEPDGLTRVEGYIVENMHKAGKPVFWSPKNHAYMSRLHKNVLSDADRIMSFTGSGWTQRTVLCHYIYVRDTDCEIAANHWKPRAPRKPKAGVLPDWL